MVENLTNSSTGQKSKWSLIVHFKRNDANVNFGRDILLDEKSKLTS